MSSDSNRYLKTEAIILNSYNFSDSDRLYNVFSKEYGKIVCIGKGVRKLKSRRGSLLDTLNLVNLNLYKKNSFYYISDLNLVNNFNLLKNNLTLSSWAFYIMESVSLFSVEEDYSFDVFENTKKVLNQLSKKPSKRIVYAFLKELIVYQGFWDPSYYIKFPYLKDIQSKKEVSTENQKSIDLFFSTKIEEITEKKLNSVLLISSL
ncbi:DNA repair protein RecO [candidate division WWE3 bacterium CG10_big_fil_rev_8_21_14_0_10_32_10]|uniref:DNA repair protein RecO n=1 Tax=candidate division WWE3 bacterium CG10_big_fil_rev_8_21_14_0_10_32_10 TaxID=1975090 RepID=A0A2H0R8Z7_UNCKA|nr:MAG: DNA repair protein RecO [candidate division WWE3 bacterium CG10_big_fil_rev_8_21_14_0_10_32_10]